MKRRWKNLLLTVPVALSVLWGALILLTRFIRCPAYGRRLVQLILLRKDTASPKTEFHLFMAATVRGPSGSTGDEYIYQSSDCVEVSAEYYTLASLADAEAEITRRLKTDYKIYEHTTRADSKGGLVERAVTQAERRGEYLILRGQGQKIRVISSSSLPHALEFERRLDSGSASLRSATGSAPTR